MRYWALGLGATELKACLNIGEVEANTKVSVVLEWSLDGVNWNPGETLITDVTAMGDYVASSSVASQQTPFQRLAIEVKENTASAEVFATVSLWTYVRYNG